MRSYLLSYCLVFIVQLQFFCSFSEYSTRPQTAAIQSTTLLPTNVTEWTTATPISSASNRDKSKLSVNRVLLRNQGRGLFYLAVYSDGKIRGERNNSRSRYAILDVIRIKPEIVAIKGVESDLYICVNKRNRVRGYKYYSPEKCNYKEISYGRRSIYYKPFACERCYLRIKPNGKIGRITGRTVWFLQTYERFSEEDVPGGEGKSYTWDAEQLLVTRPTIAPPKPVDFVKISKIVTLRNNGRGKFYLAVYPNGTVRGEASGSQSNYSIFNVSSAGERNSIVTIRGIVSGRFVCVNQRNRVKGFTFYKETRCDYKEFMYTERSIFYKSLACDRCYLRIKSNAKVGWIGGSRELFLQTYESFTQGDPPNNLTAQPVVTTYNQSGLTTDSVA